MDLEEFRIAHSTLIEHYQYIEAHLEGIYAAISGKPFLIGIQEVEKDSLGGVVREIQEMEGKKNIQVLTEDEHRQLRQLIERRNYWCHCCYYDMVFDRETGGPAKVRDIHTLLEDMQKANQWREQLYQKKMKLIKKNR